MEIEFLNKNKFKGKIRGCWGKPHGPQLTIGVLLILYEVLIHDNWNLIGKVLLAF